MNSNFKWNFIDSILWITGNYLIMKPNYLGLANSCIYEIKCMHEEETKELYKNSMYLLFMKIIEDVQLSMNSLINTNQEMDHFRYVDIKRNCRSIVESYIDMLNLQFNHDYLEIIKLNCKYKNFDEGKINKILESANIKKIKIKKDNGSNRFINISEKINILNQYNIFDKEEQEFYKEKLIRYLNKYSHPNILITEVKDVFNINSIKSILSIAIECLDRSYILIINNIYKNLRLENKIYINKLDKSIEICLSNLDKWISYETSVL